MELIVTCVISAVLFLSGVCCYGIWINGYFRRRGIKYIKPKFLFIGNLFECALKKEHCFLLMHKVYNAFPNSGYVGFFEFTKPQLIIKDLNLIKDIGIKEYEHFSSHRVYIDGNSDPLFGNFLITLRGRKWKDMRTALTPAFTKNKLKGMFAFITICGEQLNHFLEKEIEISTRKSGKQYMDVDINNYLKRYTNDVISSTAFGLENNSLKNPNNEMLQYGMNVAHLDRAKQIKFMVYSIFPKIMKFFGVPIYDKKTIKFFNETVHNLINYRIKNDVVRSDMIQLLVEAKQKTAVENETVFSDDDITAQAVLFYIGGFESTSLVSSALIYELALRPDLQKRLQNEIDEIIQSNDELTLDIIDSMKYLDMTVSETLRLWPTVAYVDRECQKDYTLLCDSNTDAKSYKLNAKEIVWIPIYSIQRDPKYFSEPDKFDPERFAPENKDSFNPMAYMPFGIGPRKCIGIRYALIVIKVVVFYLLSRFDFIATEKTSMQLVIDPNSLVFQSKDGYWVGVKKREKIAQ